MRNFLVGCGSFFDGVEPFGGHARSLSPALGAGIPDWAFAALLGLVLVDADSAIFLVCAPRLVIGELSFLPGEPLFSGGPIR